jgi:hypothetical protein
MVLQMARSTKRPGSLNNQFIRRVPADLVDRLKGRMLRFSLPSGELDQPEIPVRAKAGVHIAFSLQTADKALTTVRHAAALAQVEALFKAERSGPQDLSFKQVQALAGIAYRRLIADNEEDPGQPHYWAMFRSLIAAPPNILNRTMTARCDPPTERAPQSKRSQPYSTSTASCPPKV